MPKPAVSILMPVYNPHPIYFSMAVGSIRSQTFRDWELIIVEDPSPNPAGKMLKNIADDRIRLITNSQRTGLISQRNRTIFEARADIVALMDADDIADHYRIEKQFAFLADNPKIDLVGSSLRIINNKGNVIGYRRYPTMHDEICAAMPRYCPVAHPSVMVRKHAIEAVGSYRTYPAAEDYDLWSRMVLAGFRFQNIDDYLLNYRFHSGSLSKGKNARKILICTRLVKKKYWWKVMKWHDRLRYYGESLISTAPTEAILFLFRFLTYGKSICLNTDLGLAQPNNENHYHTIL